MLEYFNFIIELIDSVSAIDLRPVLFLYYFTRFLGLCCFVVVSSAQ